MAPTSASTTATHGRPRRAAAHHGRDAGALRRQVPGQERPGLRRQEHRREGGRHLLDRGTASLELLEVAPWGAMPRHRPNRRAPAEAPLSKPPEALAAW